MTYEQIVGKALVSYAKADASAIDGHIAIQFNVTGEGQGAFYLEVTDGKIDIQPYEYYDRNAIITISSGDLMRIFDGELSINDAYNDHRMRVDGDLGAVLLLTRIIRKEEKTVTTEKAKGQKKIQE